MRRWLCHPLSTTEAIEERLKAIDDLNANPSVKGLTKNWFRSQKICNPIESHVLIETITTILSQLPDLERMLSRVHAFSSNLENILLILDSFEQIAVRFQASLLLSSF